MIKKFTAYLLIIFLIIPPTFFIKPQKADAYLFLLLGSAVRSSIPAISRKVVTIAARAGFGRYAGYTQLKLPLKPQRGKLYNLVFKRQPITYSGIGTTTLATAIFAFLGYTDNKQKTCPDFYVQDYGYSGFGGSFSAQTHQDALAQAIADSHSRGVYPGFDPVIDPTAPNPIPLSQGVEYGSTTSTGLWHGNGWIVCRSIAFGVTDLDQFVHDVEILPPSQQASKLDALLNETKKQLQNPTSSLPDASTITEGVGLEEVQSLTFTDANGVTHTYSYDANGNLTLDGKPVGDTATIVDKNGVEHNYTIDPVTGNILDNGKPVGNFAEWTDADGVVHKISMDPITGQLLIDGKPWNPAPNRPTASNPSAGSGGTTVTTDPYTGQITINNNLDLQPLIDVQASMLTEQKKTTDALIKTNKNLKDVYSSNQELNKSAKKQELILKDIYSAVSKQNNVNTSGKKETRPMNLQGIQTTAQNIINSSSIATWGDAMRVAGPSGLPIFTIPTMFGDVSFDTSTYKFAFDAVGILTLIAASYISILIIFKSK